MSDGSYTPSLLTNIALIGAVVIIVFAVYEIEVGRLGRRDKHATYDEKFEAAKRAFDKIDRDGDGIDLEEVSRLVLKCAPTTSSEQVLDLFNAADKDGGGTIDFTEFHAALYEDKVAATCAAFEAIDVDGDGIELDEVTKLILECAPATTAAQIKALFKQADADSSGVIDLAEFQAALADHPLLHVEGQIDLNALVSRAERTALKSDAAGRVSLLAFLLYGQVRTDRNCLPKMQIHGIHHFLLL